MGIVAIALQRGRGVKNLKPFKKIIQKSTDFFNKTNDVIGDTLVITQTKKTVKYVKGRTLGRIKAMRKRAIEEIRTKKIKAKDKKNTRFHKIIAPVTGTVKGVAKEVKVDDLPILTAGLGIAVPLPMMTTLGFFLGEACVRGGKLLCNALKKIPK